MYDKYIFILFYCDCYYCLSEMGVRRTYFKCSKKHLKPSYFVLFKNLSLLHSIYKRMLVQILRHFQSSERVCQCDESLCSDRSLALEQVLGERTLSTMKVMMIVIRLCYGTSLCYCKSL